MKAARKIRARGWEGEKLRGERRGENLKSPRRTLVGHKDPDDGRHTRKNLDRRREANSLGREPTWVREVEKQTGPALGRMHETPFFLSLSRPGGCLLSKWIYRTKTCGGGCEGEEVWRIRSQRKPERKMQTTMMQREGREKRKEPE